MPHKNRHKLLNIMEAALSAVDGERQVIDALARHPVPADLLGLVAVGKAAPAMAAGACAALGETVETGLVITKQGHCGLRALPPRVRCREAGHPYPDARSLDAGATLLAYLQALPDRHGVLFLLSGGASALLESLPEGMTGEDLAKVNRWLLYSGLDIVAVNRMRKRLSCLKAGRLARYLAGRAVLQLLLPDVPGNHPDVIGSGPLVPEPEAETAAALPSGLPDWFVDLLSLAPPAPHAREACFSTIRTVCLGGNAEAMAAARQAGQALGLVVHTHDTLLCGEAAVMGERVAATVLAGAPGLHVWGGETTVSLPAHPGVGGRNQHLALAAARRLAGQAGVWLLAVGTDGTDGPTEDAGALVDGGTVARGEAQGLSAEHCLDTADAGRFLALSGDLLRTGPTGTNVMDLVLALRTTDR